MVELLEKGGNGFFEVGVGRFRESAMGLPNEVSFGIGEDNVGVVGGTEVREFFPVVDVIVERNEVGLLLRSEVFAHAMKDHGPYHAGSAFELGHLVVINARIFGEFGADAFAPG